MDDKKVSIYDVAEYCGLSVASVSYAINGKKKVSEKTRSKVLEAIDVLGYYPNYTARALSTGKTGLVGILLPLNDASIAFLQNPFYVELIGGFEKVSVQYNYDIIIGMEQKEEKLEDWIKRRTIDGLILIGSHPESTYQILKNINIPIVLIDDYSNESKYFNNIRTDDTYGMYIATKHLIENGHKKIGFVGNHKLYLIDNMRYLGYQKAMEEAGLKITDDKLYMCDATFDEGLKIAENIIKDKNVTAVVCSADILGIAIIKKAEELGYKIPDDLSIVGFDDVQSANYLYPGLTTVHQEIGQKGILAANILIDILEHKEQENKNLVLEPYLVKRESVKTV